MVLLQYLISISIFVIIIWALGFLFIFPIFINGNHIDINPIIMFLGWAIVPVCLGICFKCLYYG